MTLISVSGPIELGGSGSVLPHEHLVIDYRQMAGAAGPVSRFVEDQCVELLKRARGKGVQTIVDCTPPGYGRDISFLRAVSRRSGVAIVASTGTFCEEWHPQPNWAANASVVELASMFIAELRRDCGVIKVATSTTATNRELKALDAAAQAHQETGARIICHTTGGFGIEAVNRLAQGGVDPAAILVSHVCSANESLDYALEIARLGAYVGLDRIGHTGHNNDHWLAIIEAFEIAGFEHQILVSHDSVQVFAGPDEIAGNTFSDLVYLFESFDGAGRGLTAEQLRAFTRRNPHAWLAGKDTK